MRHALSLMSVLVLCCSLALGLTAPPAWGAGPMTDPLLHRSAAPRPAAPRATALDLQLRRARLLDRRPDAGRLVPFDLNRTMYDFYLYEITGALKQARFDPFRHSHFKARYPIEPERAQAALMRRFAPRLLRFLVLAIAREFASAGPMVHRWAGQPAWLLEGLRRADQHPYEQYEARARAVLSAARDHGLSTGEFARFAREHFRGPEWSYGYGGKGWAMIADAVASFDDYPVKAWIDHVFDLQHNYGSVFTKFREQTGFDAGLTWALLEVKRDAVEPIDMVRDLWREAELSGAPVEKVLSPSPAMRKLLLMGVSRGFWSAGRGPIALGTHRAHVIGFWQSGLPGSQGAAGVVSHRGDRVGQRGASGAGAALPTRRAEHHQLPARKGAAGVVSPAALFKLGEGRGESVWPDDRRHFLASPERLIGSFQSRLSAEALN